MLGSLCCRIGLHGWSYYPTNDYVCVDSCNNSLTCRVCRRCGKFQEKDWLEYCDKEFPFDVVDRAEYLEKQSELSIREKKRSLDKKAAEEALRRKGFEGYRSIDDV